MSTEAEKKALAAQLAATQARKMEVENHTEFSTADIIARFPTVNDFRVAMETAGFVVIDDPYVTYPYIIQVMGGHKELIKTSEIPNWQPFPK